jgi:hypothetical protein
LTKGEREFVWGNVQNSNMPEVSCLAQSTYLYLTEWATLLTQISPLFHQEVSHHLQRLHKQNNSEVNLLKIIGLENVNFSVSSALQSHLWYTLSLKSNSIRPEAILFP